MLRVGSFVVVEGSRDGVGRLIAADKRTADVEYLVSPVGPQVERREVPVTNVHPIELPAQTVIFWNDPAASGGARDVWMARWLRRH